MLPGPHVLNKLDDHVYTQLDELDGVTLYHGRPWHRVLERAFGWRVQALVDYDCGGRLALFLPFVEKRRLGRKVRVSLPLSHSIGPATKPGYRFSFPVWLAPFEAHAELLGLQPHTEHVVTELDMSTLNTEANFFTRFRNNDIRRRIRRAKEAGFLIRTGAELMTDFATLQARTRWRQGAPTYPKRFFPLMAEELGNIVHCHLAVRHGQPAAGVVTFRYNQTVMYGYSASNETIDARQAGANQLTLWHAICDARGAGCTLMDFGSSPIQQMGLWKYKEQWGGVSRPLIYSSVGMNPVSQHSTLVRCGSAILRRLPLRVFEALSPPLLRAAV